MNDGELIRRIQSGDKSCFEELIAGHYDEVYRFCCYKTGNAALSYDLTQTTFLKLIKYMEAYVHKDRFKSYLFSIALNVCNSHFSEKGNGPAFLELNEEQELISGDFTVDADSRTQISVMLEKLPEVQRDAVILRYFHDMKIKDIARITGAKIPTVKSRLRQAIRQMNQMMSEEVCRDEG